jgi:plasmid maintenance system antidote protein VapI
MTNESLTAYLRRNLLGRGATPNDVARQLGITRPALDNLLNGGGLSVPVALKLEAVCGMSARDLLIRQVDEQIAARHR